MAIKWTSALCPGCRRNINVEERHGQYLFALHDVKPNMGGLSAKMCPESGQPMPPLPPAPKGTPPWMR